MSVLKNFVIEDTVDVLLFSTLKCQKWNRKIIVTEWGNVLKLKDVYFMYKKVTVAAY